MVLAVILGILALIIGYNVFRNFSSLAVICKMSLRNLFRQKRRNIMLGVAISFGIAIIVVSNAFSAGITDVLFNKVVVNIVGHVQVSFKERGKESLAVFRDKEEIAAKIKKSAPEVKEIRESITVFARVIGNGEAQNIPIIGSNPKDGRSAEKQKEFEKGLKIVQGSYEDFKNPKVENPIIISTEKAKELKLKLHDSVNVKFTTIYGQRQTAKMNVVAIEKSDNLFANFSINANLKDMKRLMGYKEWESADIQLIVENPKQNAKRTADKIYKALTPEIVGIAAGVTKGDKNGTAEIYGYGMSEAALMLMKKSLKAVGADIETAVGKDGALINKRLAEKLGAKIGDDIKISYKKKFEEGNLERGFVIDGIIEDLSKEDSIFLNEAKFYDVYLNNIPKDEEKKIGGYFADEKSGLSKALSKEWFLAERTKSREEMKKKDKEYRREKVKATVVNVYTMYEAASMVIMMESALNMITFVAVLVLFIIILIGVINTLRMTVRERTREIGTIRAVGMQKKDVRNLFIFETFFLAMFSAAAGIAGGAVVSWLLSLIKINVGENPISILLVNGHMNFKPDIGGLTVSIGAIVIMTIATAYMPARRAANMKPTEAMRHYE